MVVKDPETLRKTIATVLRAAGADERNVEIVAEHLKGAELCGVQTHGIFQIPHYIDEIAKKELMPTAWPEILKDEGNRATVTGNVGFGHSAADFSVRLAIEKAKEHGLTAVGLVRANHIGRLGHYAEMAAAEGMVAMIFASGFAVNGARAAAFGGRERVLDTNPYCVGIPTGDGTPPMIVDFATTHGSMVKVMNAQRRGEKLVEGVIVDSEGRTTTDPNDFYDGGALAPFGGHKGYAIMTVVELMGRVFAGADSHAREGEGTDLMRHQGVTFLVLRADALGPMSDFITRVDGTLERITSSEPAVGVDKVMYPGQMEEAKRRKWGAEGIPFAEDVWERFAEAALKVGVEV
jgi:uncharacterized oxidoreductase